MVELRIMVIAVVDSAFEVVTSVWTIDDTPKTPVPVTLF
jgi:hypothetical protein